QAQAHLSVGNSDVKLLIETTAASTPQRDQSIEFKDSGGSWYIGQDWTTVNHQFGIGRTSSKQDIVIASNGQTFFVTAPSWPSDIRLKKDVASLGSELDKL